MRATFERRRAAAAKGFLVRLVDEDLCQLVGGQNLLLESKVTKAALLQFLKANGLVREVKGVVEMMVHMMSGIIALVSSSKRRQAEAEAEAVAHHVSLVDEELCQLAGGHRVLLESELTRAHMLLFLKAKDFIREVKGVVEVMVQTLDDGSFCVILEEGSTVADLKSEIQEAQGAALYRQQLFMLMSEGTEGGNEVHEPLSDNQEIRDSCTVMLCVQAEAEWSWDASSPLLERKVFELRGPNNSVAAKIDEDDDYQICIVAEPVMEAGTGKHTISMQLVTRKRGISCGVVSDGAACDERHCKEESTVGWSIYRANGSLNGNGKFGDDSARRINSGDVLTMQVDTDACMLKF